MRKNKFLTIVGGVTALLFISLTISIKTSAIWLHTLDTAVQNLIVPTVNPVATKYISLIAILGSPFVAICWTILIAFLLWRKERNLINAGWLLITQFSGCAGALMIKELVHRFRPADQVIKNGGFSFPSGHTFATAIVVLAVLYFIVPWLQDRELQFVVSLLSIGWVILIGFTRLYLRAHFFSDVCGSLLLAITWWEVMKLFYFRLWQKFFHTNRGN